MVGNLIQRRMWDAMQLTKQAIATDGSQSFVVFREGAGMLSGSVFATAGTKSQSRGHIFEQLLGRLVVVVTGKRWRVSGYEKWQAPKLERNILAGAVKRSATVRYTSGSGRTSRKLGNALNAARSATRSGPTSPKIVDAPETLTIGSRSVNHVTWNLTGIRGSSGNYGCLCG